MSTVRQLVTRAFRYLGKTSEGMPAPNAYDADVGLQGLKGLYLQYIADGAFGDLTDVLISADYTANENERIITTSGTPVITLPTTITEDDGTVRGVYDRSVVIEAGGSSYLYDADRAAWYAIETLTLDSTAPLSQRYGTGLAALLAVSLAPEYRTEPTATAAALADEGARALRMSRRLLAVIDPAIQAGTVRLAGFDITTGL